MIYDMVQPEHTFVVSVLEFVRCQFIATVNVYMILVFSVRNWEIHIRFMATVNVYVILVFSVRICALVRMSEVSAIRSCILWNLAPSSYHQLGEKEWARTTRLLGPTWLLRWNGGWTHKSTTAKYRCSYTFCGVNPLLVVNWSALPSRSRGNTSNDVSNDSMILTWYWRR